MAAETDTLLEKIGTTTFQYLGVSENNKVRHVLETFVNQPKTIIVEKSKMGNPFYIIKTLAEFQIGNLNLATNQRKLRDRFICGILFWGGLRERELTLVEKKDIDFISRTFNVPTIKQRKGIMYRPIPLNHVPANELKLWNQYFEVFEIKDKVVDLNVRSIQRAVRRVLDLHPHALRHGLGLFLYELTKDIRLVAQVLRHTNIANTMIYTKLSLEGIREKITLS